MSVAVTSFLAFGAAQVATPGPANMALLTTGAAHGFRAAVPFVAGVALGKQLIIWPMGFGLMALAEKLPQLFVILKYISAAYILWLAYRVTQLRLGKAGESGKVPGFFAGLLVHPLNPKAWAMIVTGFTSFVSAGTSALQATATIAICLLACQMVFHPIWTLGGEQIAKAFAGTPAEAWLMRTLAALTVVSVLIVLFGGASK